MRRVEATCRLRVKSTIELIARSVHAYGLRKVLRRPFDELKKLGAGALTKMPQQKVIQVVNSLEVEPGKECHLPDGAKEVAIERLPNGNIRILFSVAVSHEKGL